MKKVSIASILISLIILLSLALGCASSTSQPIPSIPMAPPGISSPASAPSLGKGITGEDYYGPSNTSNGGTSDIDRKIVKTGYITLIVTSVTETMPKITSLVSQYDGYVVSANKTEGEDAIVANISIRVPAQKYDDVLAELRKLATKVPQESTNAQDVTEEYIDLKARLGNLEAEEAQYLEILKKAETVEDMIKVQDALSNVRGEIEQTKARIQYLDRTTDMSLIEISLREEKTFHENGWNVFDTLKSAVRGLEVFGKVLLNIIIWLLVFIPLWIIIGVIVWVILRRKKKAKMQTK